MCRHVFEDASQYFSIDENDIHETLPVSAAYLAGLDRILASIINKRNKGLRSTTSGATGQAEPPHYQHFRDYFTTGQHTGFIPLDARRATGRGFEYDASIGGYRLIPDTAEGKKGSWLATTAALYHRTAVGDPNWKPIYNTEDPLTKLLVYELENIGESGSSFGGAVGTGAYRQQIANMDIIFNFFLWMRIFYVQKKDKGSINIFLNLLGDKYIGKLKIMQLIRQTTKMSTLLPHLNSTGSMYIPPYAITARRVYYFVAVFCGLRYNRLQESFMSPGISTRYISHSRLSRGQAMKFVVRISSKSR